MCRETIAEVDQTALFCSLRHLLPQLHLWHGLKFLLWYYTVLSRVLTRLFLQCLFNDELLRLFAINTGRTRRRRYITLVFVSIYKIKELDLIDSLGGGIGSAVVMYISRG